VFDGTDVLDAAAELDQRFAQADAKHAAALLELWSRFTHAYSSSDWVAFKDVFASDLVVVDHRPASAGTLGRDAFVSYIRELVDLMHGVNVYASEIPALAAGHGLFQTEVIGHNDAGGDVEISLLVHVEARESRIARLDAFPLDEQDVALALFEAVSHRGPGLENACVRRTRRFAQLFAHDDWAEMGRLMSSEDYLFEDRRRGLQTMIRDRAESIENLRALKAVGVDELPFTVIATRGERLALCRYTLHGRDPDSSFGAETLVINEVGDDGEMLSGIVFEPEDLDAAFNELNERYLAGEGRAYAHLLRLETNRQRLHRRDWVTYREQLHDDIVLVDHRPAGAGTLSGPDEVTRYSAVFVELVPNAQLHMIKIVAIETDRMLYHLNVHGSTEEGAAVDRPLLALVAYRDGRLHRFEQFALEDSAAALARFTELGRTEAPKLENAAARAGRRFADTLVTQDWETLTPMLGPDSRWDDRRHGLRSFLRGPDRLQNARELAAVGVVRSEQEVVAIRGDRLLLSRVVVRAEGDASFESDLLVVGELHDDGVQWSSILFDPDDIDDAFVELDTLYAAGEGAAYREAVLAQSKLSRAINERRWDDFADLLDPDLVVHDRRPASLGEVAAADWPAAMDALADVIVNYRSEQQFFRALAADRWWLQLHNRGESEDGGEVDFSFQSVGQVRDGRIVRLEIFSDAQTEDARAFFESLGSVTV
jgi:hypothetical protein